MKEMVVIIHIDRKGMINCQKLNLQEIFYNYPVWTLHDLLVEVFGAYSVSF